MQTDFVPSVGHELNVYTRASFISPPNISNISLYRVGHKKVARLPFAFAFDYCINFCFYAMDPGYFFVACPV